MVLVLRTYDDLPIGLFIGLVCYFEVTDPYFKGLTKQDKVLELNTIYYNWKIHSFLL